VRILQVEGDGRGHPEIVTAAFTNCQGTTP